MAVDNKVVRSFDEAVRAALYKGWRKMISGRRISGNVVTLSGAPEGKVWVRETDGSYEATAVYGRVELPNVFVWVGPDPEGYDQIKGIAYAASVPKIGNMVHLATQVPIAGDVTTLKVMGLNFVPGRVRPYAASGSMLLYIEPFAHHNGRWPGGAFDPTSLIPATSGTCAWAAIAIDPATNTAYGYAGSESYDAPTNLDEADAHAITVPDGYIPMAAAALEEGMTEITSATRIIDLRPHFYMRGGLIRALDDLANVNTTGKADGDALVWNAGASEWVTDAVAGAIDVTDGTTTVSPATELLFDATKFDVIDNGGGQAEVTFIGTPVASGSKTRYVGTIIHEETLGSDGAFDVSSIPADYENLELIIRARSTASTADGIRIFFNNDTTLTNYRRVRLITNGTTVSTTTADDGLIGLAVGASELADNYSEIRLFIPHYADTTQHKTLRSTNDYRTAASTHELNSLSVWWENTAAINRIAVQTDNHSTDLLATGSTLTIIGWREEAIGGLDTSTADVSNPPTDAELDSALGTPASVGAGYQCLLDDGGADANVYLVASNGTSWWYTALTKAT